MSLESEHRFAGSGHNDEFDIQLADLPIGFGEHFIVQKLDENGRQRPFLYGSEILGHRIRIVDGEEVLHSVLFKGLPIFAYLQFELHEDYSLLERRVYACNPELPVKVIKDPLLG